MYGTVARMRLKPGAMDKMQEQMKAYEGLNVPGQVDTLIFQMDQNANEIMLVAVFEDKASYVKNAESPAQNARYEGMRALLESDPEWNDGEVIYQMK